MRRKATRRFVPIYMMLKEAVVFERRELIVWNTVLRRSQCLPVGLVSSAELCFVQSGGRRAAILMRSAYARRRREKKKEGTNASPRVQGSQDFVD
jgi:hypothetical protein